VRTEKGDLLTTIKRWTATAVTISVAATGIANAEPAYQLDAAQENVVSLTNLATEGFACNRATLNGKVVYREFERGTNLKILVIEEPSGDRTNVNVTIDTSGLPMVDLGYIVQGLQRISKEGTEVEVGVLRCGAAGRVLWLDSIRRR
jgi:hypothetical protein